MKNEDKEGESERVSLEPYSTVQMRSKRRQSLLSASLWL